MMNERAHRLKAIFHAALELPTPEQREAFLQEACRGDEKMRDEVAELLKAAKEAEAIFPTRDGHPPGGSSQPPWTQELSEGPGTLIGRYKLLQKIGEGGFGVVYMAEQREPVKRRVALKIIKLGMDTKQVVGRFEAERQALALMEHPNIARVLDAGATETGRPYFVMELVRGVPITNFCDENNLTLDERLELFVPVCQAIQHAHQKGIIHRDLKPSNILVTMHDDKPVAKVIDFGIAKATQQELTTKTVFTQFQQFIGTPAYMSPEQAQMSGLDLDTRSDVYSLGVLLYELLTGQTPFDVEELLSAGYEEIRRRIREEEPPKPSTKWSTLQAERRTAFAKLRRSEPDKLGRFLKGDLDWIVMKTLEKDRTRRYETANGLALDIRRHLANEPVSAAAPSPVYRLRKFSRRHRRILTTAGVAGLLLAITVATSMWQSTKARNAEAAAREAAQLAREARAAEEELRDAQNLAEARAQLELILADTGQNPAVLGVPSPDGSMVAYADFGLTGAPLTLLDVVSGEKTVLKKGPLIPTAYEMGLVMGFEVGAWSPDSSAICLPWYRNRNSEVLIVPLEGTPRVLIPANPDRDFSPHEWSPSGKSIVCTMSTQENHSGLVLVNATTGEVQSLEVEGNHPRFSPDERFLVYQGVGAQAGNLFVHDIPNKTDYALTAHPENDTTPIWSADGRHVIFSSHRRESWDLWAVAVQNGRPKGGPFLIRSGMGSCGKGRHASGDIMISINVNFYDPAFIEFKPTGHLGSPTRFTEMTYGKNLFIGWSPDGNRIAYLRSMLDGDDQEVCLLDLANGTQERFKTGFYAREAFWHPKENSIFLFWRKAAKLDLETGETRVIVESLSDAIKPIVGEVSMAMANFHPLGWIPQDDRLLIRVGHEVTLYGSPAIEGSSSPTQIALDLASGEAEQITAPPEIGAWDFYSLSPDGTQVAYLVDEARTLMLANRDFSEARILATYSEDEGKRMGDPEWSPDGKNIAYIVFVKMGGQNEIHIAHTESDEIRVVESSHHYVSTRKKTYCWSPDSRKLAFTLVNESTEIFRLRNLERLLQEKENQAGPPEI